MHAGIGELDWHGSDGHNRPVCVLANRPQKRDTMGIPPGRCSGKIRHKAMRGYKRLRSALLSTFVLASLGGALAGVSYSSLLS